MFQVHASVSSSAELRATAAYLNTLAELREKRTVIGGTIRHEDNPATGAPETMPPAPEAPPPWPLVIGNVVTPSAYTPPVNPAAVFGGAVAQVPPPPLNDAALTPAAPPVVSPPTAAIVPTAAPASVELDAAGLPWDGRIHGSTRTKNQDGTWRQKRGLNDAALKARVEAELRAVQALPVPAAPVVPVPPASAVPLPPAASAVVPVPPPANGGVSETANTPTPADAAVTTLPQLMQQVAPHMAAGRLTMPMVIESCAHVGVPSLAVLGTRPDLVPAVWAHLQPRVVY